MIDITLVYGRQLQSHHPLRQHALQGVRKIDMADAIFVINVGGVYRREHPLGDRVCPEDGQGGLVSRRVIRRQPAPFSQPGTKCALEWRRWPVGAGAFGYSVTWINGSPRAVEISAMDLSVRFGKPVVQRDTTASDRFNLRARSRWVMFFFLRMASSRAMMAADSCTSDITSGATADTFSWNHSCFLFISSCFSYISNVKPSIPVNSRS